VQPKLDPGLGTTLLSKLGDAAGLASTAYGLYDAKKMADLQRQSLQGQIDRGKLTEDIARGTALGAGSILPKTTPAPPQTWQPPVPHLMSDKTAETMSSMPSELFPASKLAAMPSELFPASRGPSPLAGPSGAGPRLPAPHSIELGGSVAPGGLSDVGQAAFSTAQNERIASRAAAQRAAQDRLRAGQLDEARYGKLLAETEKIGAETLALDPTRLTYDDSITRATPLVQSLAQARKPWSEVATSPSLSKIDPQALPQLRAAYEAEAAKVMGEANKGVSDFLYGDVRQLASQNALLKKSSDLQFGANLLVTGYDQDNGPGDLQMVTASVRLGDPGMGVRPAEAAQWEESGGMVQGWLVFGEKFKEGDRFTPKVRDKLLKAGLDQYNGSIGLVDRAVGNLQSAAVPRILQMTGSEDINAVPGVNEFFENYRLPPLEAYGNLSPKTLELYRKMGAAASQPSRAAGVDLEALEAYKPGGQVGGNILSTLSAIPTGAWNRGADVGSGPPSRGGNLFGIPARRRGQ